MNNTKFFALLEELETSNKLIRLGFGELQNLNQVNSFYFLPFQLLSQGFERLMKAYICIAFYQNNKVLPDFKYLLKLGHDLDKLLNEIIENYYYDYDRVQYQIDLDFLVNDKDFLHLLRIISEFGKHGRYYNFDVITDSNKPSINTVELWQDYEHGLIKKLAIPYEKIGSLDSTINSEVYYEMSRYIIVFFEKFVSALSRQVIFGKLGEIGKQLTANNIFDFGLIYEEKLGITDYRKITTTYTATPKFVYKRTAFDDLERSLNPNFKFIVIRQDDFKGVWPFYSSQVIVESRDKYWYVVTIDGYDYALNGSAKNRYKLESPHDAGMAIIGKSISEFIEIARKL